MSGDEAVAGTSLAAAPITVGALAMTGAASWLVWAAAIGAFAVLAGALLIRFGTRRALARERVHGR